MRDAPLPGTPPPPARRGLERQTSFLVVAIVAAVGMGIVFWMGRPSREASDQGHRSPAGQTAEEEVLASLRNLFLMKDRAFDTNDLSLLEEIYAPRSPAARRARAGMQRLIKADVFDASRVEITSLRVEKLSATTALITRTATLYPCFRSLQGKDVTRSPGVIKQFSSYELKRVGNDWLIWDATLERDRVLIKEKSSCARI